MPFFIDRRQNPKGKSIGNRRRFLARARERIKAVVDQSVKDRKITDIADGDVITIPTKGIEEPRFHHGGKTGHRTRVLPGNKEFMPGDKIPKPPAGQGGRGREGSEDGEGEDDFQFTLSRQEFLDIFFDDLELPDLVKTSLKEIQRFKPRRAGHARFGNTANLNVGRTMRNSLGRRIALKRPNLQAVSDLLAAIDELETKREPGDSDTVALLAMREELALMERKRKVVAYIDPHDVRYNVFEQTPEPNTQAVMFCLMDVSGSMGEREKDLAKRFFILLHLFLERRYEKVEVVFIRHTHEASEVDEDTFFHSRETGGTIVSTALREMTRVVKERYPSNDWNIYAAQASDGENFSSDDERCRTMLAEDVMPLVQYYAYVEIVGEDEWEFVQASDSGAALWRAYQEVSQDWRNFAMKRISKPGDIFPVFRELFHKQTGEKV